MFFFILIQYVLFNVVLSISQHPVLIIVSYDAFRYNYFQKNATLYMEKLRMEGTHADYLINVFPTKTFPNHHSIATGMFTETHGVVGNSFYDPKLKEIIKISDQMWNYNEEVIPIWLLNERAGPDRYSGSMMWPGGFYKYQNKQSTYSVDWDPKVDYYKRVDTIMSWIKNPDKPANLIMFYIEEPDSQGHAYGPESSVVLNILKKLDNVTKYLDEQIKANKLEDVVNVIHLSDHGMSTVSLENVIDITKYLQKDTYEIADSSPCLHIIPNTDYMEETYNRLKNQSRESGHFTVYKKQDLPVRWHFKNNRRTPPIFVLSDLDYGFQDLTESAEYYSKNMHIKVDKNTKLGVHGYDNDLMDMHPFFMARGPKVKKNYKVKPFHTVDLYNLFCDILEIKAPPNNGTSANIKDILVNSSNIGRISTLGIAVGAVIAAILLISCGAAITLFMIKRQQNITTTAALNKRFPQTFSNASIEAQHLLEPEEA